MLKEMEIKKELLSLQLGLTINLFLNKLNWVQRDINLYVLIVMLSKEKKSSERCKK